VTRRLATLVIATLAAAGAVVGAAVPAHAEDKGRDHDWACIFVTDLDSGYCQQSPLPDELPSTSDVTSAVPSVPAPTAPSI
jgi:hypothetical protein